MSLLSKIQALSPELLAQKNTQAITDALNADTTRTEIVEYWLTDRGMSVDIVAAKGGDTAISDSILTKLDLAMESSRTAKAQINRLYTDSKGLNFGDPFLRGWFVAMTPSLFTQEECDALLALPVRQKIVDEFSVRKLCWSDDGQWIV